MFYWEILGPLPLTHTTHLNIVKDQSHPSMATASPDNRILSNGTECPVTTEKLLDNLA